MRKMILVLVAMAFPVTLAMAQDYIDFNIMGTGARARGMGGAFIGVADDATAVGWNPAGIAQLDKMEASAVGLFANHKYTYELSSSSYSDKWEQSVSHIAPAFASFVFPIKAGGKNLVFGAAFQRMIDMAYGEKDEGTWSGGTWESEYTMKGGLDAITPAIAYQVTPQVMLGAAGNFYILGPKNEYTRTYSDGDVYKEKTDFKFSGMNFSLGGLVNTNKFNLGVCVKLPFTLTEEPSSSWSMSGSVSASGDSTYPENKYTFPMMLGFGAAFKPTDKLTIAADFEHRGYSSSEMTYKHYNTSGQLVDTTESLNWLNVNQFRVGLEYIFSGQNAVFPVRLGFRTDPKVFRGWYDSFTNPDTSQASGKVFTGGFGLIMGSVMLDLALEYGMTNYVDVEESGISLKADEKSLGVMASLIFHFK